MADNVFERLGDLLRNIPDDVKEVFAEVTREEVRENGEKLKAHLLATSGSQSLNNKMETEFIDLPDYWEYYITWNDDVAVNQDQGKPMIRTRDVKRERGKRNYSLRPATYHDLAYIIDFGHTVHYKDGGTGFVLGTRFIQHGYSKIKGWRQKRDDKVMLELNDRINKKLD